MLALLLTPLLLAPPQVPIPSGPQVRRVASVSQRPSVDSARVSRDARRAQWEFETTRRNNLPWDFTQGRGQCETRIGRFCYWPDDGESAKERPDPPRIVAARGRLLHALDSLQTLMPSDGWITGQRIKYLLEADDTVAAMTAARGCAAAHSWCAALTGYALHLTGDFAGADSAYSDALAAMPPDERCRWLDLSRVVEDGVAKLVDRAGCGGRDSLVARVWWLATPLFITGTNDLRTEHLSRYMRARMDEGARSPQVSGWADDVEELVMRYGWPTWYSREQPPPGSMAEPSIIGHDPSPSFTFYPTRQALDSTASARADAWTLRMRGARSRYAPPYVKSFRALPHQLAVFRRGDSALVVAAFDVGGGDTLFEKAVRAGLFVSTGPSHVAGVPIDSVTTHGVLTTRAAWVPSIVSLELMSAAHHAAARARYGIPLSLHHGRVSVSDLLLYAPGDSTPKALSEALPRALSTTTVAQKKPVGFFWETYGLNPNGEVLGVSLTIEEIGAPWYKRAARAMKLTSKGAPLRVQWAEVPDRGTGIASRGVAVDLSRLAPGRYRVQLTVTPALSTPVISAREILIAS